MPAPQTTDEFTAVADCVAAEALSIAAEAVPAMSEKPTEICAVAEKAMEICAMAEKPMEICAMAEKPMEMCAMAEKPMEKCAMAADCQSCGLGCYLGPRHGEEDHQPGLRDQELCHEVLNSVGSNAAGGQVQEDHGDDGHDDDGHVLDPQADVGVPGAPQASGHELHTQAGVGAQDRTLAGAAEYEAPAIEEIYEVRGLCSGEG